MTEVWIRNARISDAPTASQLITDMGYPTTAAAMTERLTVVLADSNYMTLVAETGGAVVGIIGASLGHYYEKDGLYSRIVVLAVSSAARRRGIGRQLVEAAEAWSATHGARELFLNSGFHRPEAHAFYERCGYSRTGFRFTKQLS